MNFLPSNVRKGALLGLLFFLSYISLQAQDGKAIFSANCATCHALDKALTGPALRGVETRGPWTSRANLVKWVHNPGAFIPTTPYTQQLAAQF
ncbi:MAG TPA: cytochrome c, partial [Flavisolibacter sp.]|nr:cytochrome c [Flavisolibacter sp.]